MKIIARIQDARYMMQDSRDRIKRLRNAELKSEALNKIKIQKLESKKENIGRGLSQIITEQSLVE